MACGRGCEVGYNEAVRRALRHFRNHCVLLGGRARSPLPDGRVDFRAVRSRYTYSKNAIAISLMVLFSLPLVSSLFGTAEATVPVCCRRDGRHHCAMPPEESNQGSGVQVVREKCPYTPAAPAVVLLPSFKPSPLAMFFAGIAQHPAVFPQTDAQRRISFDRTRQKRGPPLPTV